MSDELTSKIGMDTTDFKAGVSQLNASMKSIETGFRASAAVMDNWSGTSSGLKERVSSLSSIIDTQKSKLSILHGEYDKVVASEGADSKAAESLASKMFSTEKAITSTESSLSKFSIKLKTVDAEEKSSTGLGKLKTAFAGLAEQSQKSTSSITSGFGNLKSVITGFAVTAIAGLSLNSIIDATDAAEKTMAQMGAVLKSTGGAAGMTEKQLTDLAGAQAKVTTYSKGTTEQAENMLLTFTNIKSNVFPQTIKATEDMATAMHMDATDAAKTLGKALNDPAAGLAKLTKQGVTFTDAQKEQIKAMAKAGDAAGAQKIILQELEKEFGGSAKAAGSTFTGGIQIMTNNLKSAGVSIATSLMPIATDLMPSIVKGAQGLATAITSHKSEITGAVSGIATVVKDIFDFVEGHGPLVKGAVIGIAGAMALWKVATIAANVVQGISNAITVVSAIATGGLTAGQTALTAAKGSTTLATMAMSGATIGSTVAIVAHTLAMGAAKAAMAVATAAQWLFNAALTANPIGLIVVGIGLLIGAFVLAYKNCEGFRNGVNSVFKAIKDIAVGVMNTLVNFFTVTIPDVFNSVIGWVKKNWVGLLLLIVNPFAGAFKLLYDNCGGFRDFINNFVSTIEGFFVNMGNGIKNTWTSLSTAVSNIVTGLVNNAINIFRRVVNFYANLPGTLYNLGVNAFNGLRNGISSILGTIGGVVSSAFNNPIGFITSLPSKALGWGADFINGLVNGIKSAVGNITKAVSGVADTIRSFLHFSVPDQGPLRDYMSWTPDMIDGMAQGITSNTGKLKAAALKAASSLSSGLKANINIGAAGTSGVSNSNVTNNTSSPNFYITINAAGADVSKQQDMTALTKVLSNQLALTLARRTV